MKEYCDRVVIQNIISSFKRMIKSMLSSKKRPHQDVKVLCRLILWNCMHYIGGGMNLRATLVSMQKSVIYLKHMLQFLNKEFIFFKNL
jgi:hypothetical protein